MGDMKPLDQASIREVNAHLTSRPACLEQILDNVNELVVVLDSSGQIVYCNQVLENLTGFTKDTFIGKQFWDITLDTATAPISYGANTPGHLPMWERLLERQAEDLIRLKGDDFLTDPDVLRELNQFTDQYTAELKTQSHGEPSILWTLTTTVLHCDDRLFPCVICTGTSTPETYKAIRHGEARLRAILNTAVDAIIAIDANGMIEMFNPAAEKIFGYQASEVVGRNIKILMPEPYASQHDGYLGNYLRTGERKIIGIGREAEGRRKDGSTFPIDLAVSEVRLSDRVIFTGIVRDITERKMMDEQILKATESEQKRIGQDLHDGLGQRLTGLALKIGALQQHISGGKSPDLDEVNRIAALMDRAIDETRRLSRGLSITDHLEDGLAGAIEQLASDLSELTEIDCVIDGDPPILTQSQTIHLYRIAQEAINNAVRHGQPKHIQITFNRFVHPDTLEQWGHMSILDDGLGLSKGGKAGKLKIGAGLRNMKHRAQMIGGTCEVEELLDSDGTSCGTRVKCTFKLLPVN